VPWIASEKRVSSAEGSAAKSGPTAADWRMSLALATLTLALVTSASAPVLACVYQVRVPLIIVENYPRRCVLDPACAHVYLVRAPLTIVEGHP
jgi:hypothetical protein